MAFDAATAAAVLASLVARSFGNDFVIETLPTSYRWLKHPLQAAFTPVENSSNVLVVTWRGTYRNRILGDAFVCDASTVTFARAAMLNHAQDQFNLIDLQLSTLGSSLTS